MENQYVNELETLIRNRKVKKSIDKASGKKYKEIWNKWVEEEGINDITERYMCSGIKFCGADHYYDYLKHHDFNEKILTNRFKSICRKTDVTMAFRFFINLLANSLNDGNREIVVAKVIAWLPLVSYTRDKTVIASAPKYINRYFLNILNDKVELPNLNSLKLSEITINEFSRIMIIFLENIKKEKIEAITAEKIVKIENWILGNNSQSGEKDNKKSNDVVIYKKEFNKVETPSKILAEDKKQLSPDTVSYKEENNSSNKETNKKASISDIIKQLKEIDTQVEAYKNEIIKLKNINDNKVQENMSLEKSLATQEDKIITLKQEIDKKLKDIAKLNDLIEEKNMEIAVWEEDVKAKDSKIEELEAKLAESERISNMLSTEKEKTKSEAMERIAAKLRIEYADLKEAKDIPMSIDLGNNLLAQLDNIFFILGKEGINCK